jgi:hypothetical protein
VVGPKVPVSVQATCRAKYLQKSEDRKMSKTNLVERQQEIADRLAKPKLTRKDALSQMAAQIEALPDDDPRKIDLLASFLRLKGRRRTNRSVKSTKETAVRSAIRKGDVLEVLDQHDCEAYARMSPERRRAWRVMIARENVRRRRGLDKSSEGSHSGWGGNVTQEELETATKVEDGHLKPYAYGVTVHDEFLTFPTMEAGNEAITKHVEDCYTCKEDARRMFFYEELFEEAQ